MKVKKIVTAVAAAEAMGGFSYPNFGQVAEELVAAIKAGTKPSSPEGDAALECFAALELAEQSGQPLFWFATHSVGGRKIESSQDDPFIVPDWCITGRWLGYDPSRVTSALYTSATSGATLEWRATSTNEDGTIVGELTYEHPDGYEGSYYHYWNAAPAAFQMASA